MTALRTLLATTLTLGATAGIATAAPVIGLVDGTMLARLQVYGALSAFRHQRNGVNASNPARIEDVPL